MKTLSVKVPEALDARLGAVARRRKTKRSVIVRQALARYLSSPEPSSGDSFLELARDLVGS
jgi:predicted transcriptional regulator